MIEKENDKMISQDIKSYVGGQKFRFEYDQTIRQTMMRIERIFLIRGRRKGKID